MSDRRPRPRGRGTRPQGLAQSLDRLTRSLGAPDAKALSALFTGWEGIVGAPAAAHSWPISLVDGVLVIGVDEPAWATQLGYLEGDLRDRLEAALGPSGPSEREGLGPSGPSEREARGPSGPSEREARGPSGPSEREARGPSGPSEREARGPSLVTRLELRVRPR